MNFHIFLIFFATTILFSTLVLIGNSEAQPTIPSNQLLSEKEIFIFVQTIVENSEGDFVTYLTSDKFTDLDLDTLQILLENEEDEDDPIITIDGKKFRVIQRLLRLDILEENVIASTIMAHTQNDAQKRVARFAHDGYPILEGDVVTSVWTFIKPID